MNDHTAHDGVLSWLKRRRMWSIVAVVALAAGLALGREWLQAVGMLSLALSVLPCLAMCAAGLCMHRITGGSRCDGKTSQRDTVRGGHRDDPA